MIEIMDAGPFTTVQDGGRHGYAALGVPRAGPFDRAAHALANRLVGNPPEAACLEVTFGGIAVRLHAAITLALTGAPCPGLDWGTATSLPGGTVLPLGPPRHGVRSYLAVRGGLAVDAVLGSRSTDTLSGLGPAPLRAGDVLGIGPAPTAPVIGEPAVPRGTPSTLRVVIGPRADWFAPGALARFTGSAWTVLPESDRIGVRLAGPGLARAVDAELPSEPTLPGAIQVPPDGQPIVLGPDAPVTGGYPVIAVLGDAGLDALAQARPGSTVQFGT